MKKQIIELLCGIMVALAIMAIIAAFLPPMVYAQSGTGPRGERFYDYSGAILAIPTTLDPLVASPVCTKNGTFGIQNGVLYVCVGTTWSKVSLATVTPTPTATSTPTSTPTPTPTP